MIDPNQKDVKNALNIVQNGQIERASEIVDAIKHYNKLIQEDILSINFAKEGEDIQKYHQGIFDASIVVQDLVNCLSKLVNSYTEKDEDQSKYSWKNFK